MKKIENQEIEKILEELEESLKIRRYSDATKKRYNTVLRAYLYYEAENEKDLKNLTEEDVIQYLKMLTEKRNYKPSNYNNVNAILKYFLEIVLGRNIVYRKLPNAKIGYRRKNVVRKEEYEKMLANAQTTRDRYFILLAFGSGLRVSEIANLRIENIDSKNMKIKKIGKGDRERITLLPKKTLNELRKYCVEKGITKAGDYIFLNQQKKPISASTVSERVKEVAKISGINKSAHKLRGGFATQMLRMGIDPMVVQELMGHTSPETTSKYAELVRLEDKIKNPIDDGGIYE